MLQWLLAILDALAVGGTATWLARGPLRRRDETAAGIASLSAMSWRDFIRVVLEALSRRGYHRLVDHGSASGDGDFTLVRDGEHWLLSTKHGSAFVLGRAAVNELAAAMRVAGLRSFNARETPSKVPPVPKPETKQCNGSPPRSARISATSATMPGRSCPITVIASSSIGWSVPATARAGTGVEHPLRRRPVEPGSGPRRHHRARPRRRRRGARRPRRLGRAVIVHDPGGGACVAPVHFARHDL